MKRLGQLFLVFCVAGVIGCTPTEEKPKTIKVAFVTNCVADFWVYGKAGALKAGEELGIDVEVQMPANEGGVIANQKRLVEQLLSKGVDGIAISPRDPANQGSLLKQIAENTAFITHDSDAPDSDRTVFIGISNYKSGREVGKLVKRAIPDGGNVVLFIGTIGQDNGRLRRQGVIDELLDREENEKNFDEPGKPIKGEKYTILETGIDDNDRQRAKELPEQALVKYKGKINCMVGLFEYNPPKILDALKGSGELGKIAVVGFDENVQTLDAIAEGNCIGTVVQDPYQYGYQSVKVLHDIITGENEYADQDQIEIPTRVIDSKEKAVSFKKELQDLLDANK